MAAPRKEGVPWIWKKKLYMYRVMVKSSSDWAYSVGIIQPCHYCHQPNDTYLYIVCLIIINWFKTTWISSPAIRCVLQGCSTVFPLKYGQRHRLPVWCQHMVGRLIDPNHLSPLLLTWERFIPSMHMQLYPSWNVGQNYSSIPFLNFPVELKIWQLIWQQI